ncbi:MAG: ABC transporter permease [Acidobacteria bacterium]|nr:ABC transporter permease [Acidobacteriota bacterium]
MPLYRLLLRLFPRSFQDEYAREMEWMFAQRLAAARGTRLLTLWLATFYEILTNAALSHWDILRHDLRYAFRSLRHTPGFTLTVILVSAIGIGANTAVFTVTDHVLLRPFPFPESHRLVKLYERKPGYAKMELSPANYRDWRAATSFSAVGAFSFAATNMSGAGHPQRLEGAALTYEILPTLGVKPLMGRIFSLSDLDPKSPATLIISHAIWQRSFGADPTVIGRTVRLEDGPYTIIGVLPADFQFPSRKAQIWLPMRFAPIDFNDRNNNYLQMLARLKPGVSVEQARQEMTTIARRLELAYPKENEKTGATVSLFRDEISDRTRTLLYALTGASLCLLLIACANLANLLLARTLARRKELAVRASLGAGAHRLFRQLFTESTLLAFTGCALGIALAHYALPLLTILVPNSVPTGELQLDTRVLRFSVVLALLTGLGFGILPAVWATRGAAFDGLREGARSGIGGRKERLRSALVIVEIAVSFVLLVSSGLLIRALDRLQSTDPGFRPDGVLSLRTALPSPRYDAVSKQEAFFRQVLGEVRQLPGVTSAGYISFLPMTMGGGIWPVGINGRTLSRSENHTASLRFITPGFFHTMGIPLRSGRDVSESDTRDRQFVALVSRSFVQRYWPNENPIGHQFEFAFFKRTIIGVVDDIKVRGLESASEPQVYLPYKQTNDGAFSFFVPKDLVIRAANAQSLAAPVSEIIRRADPDLPISDVRLLTDLVAADTAPRRTQLRMLGLFTAIAILLAAIGIHGLLAFAVSSRAQEIGVRVALGAKPAQILTMVLRESVTLVFIGALAGAVWGYCNGRGMEAILYGISPSDPAVFLTAGAVCAAMTLLGSLLPALRALRVDPITVLRQG